MSKKLVLNKFKVRAKKIKKINKSIVFKYSLNSLNIKYTSCKKFLLKNKTEVEL